MINTIDFYYFSPTGGTKQVGEIFCEGLCTHVKAIDLGCKGKQAGQPEGELAVIAAPVYGGRIPAMAVKKLEALEGNGKLAVTLAVYGTRAYEDALLELNQAAEKQGFRVAASAALVARHSIVPAVGSTYSICWESIGQDKGLGRGRCKSSWKLSLQKRDGSICNANFIAFLQPVRQMRLCLPYRGNPSRGWQSWDKAGFLYVMHGLHLCLPATCAYAAHANARGIGAKAWGIKVSPQGK